MPINIEAIKKAREREKQDRIMEDWIMRAKKRQEMCEKKAMEEEWEEWEKQQQEYADWASEHPEELEEMKKDDYYAEVYGMFEKKLEVEKKYAPLSFSKMSRSDIKSWYCLLDEIYDKKTIEEAFRRYGNEEKEEKKKSQVEKFLPPNYIESYGVLLENLEKGGLISKGNEKLYQWLDTKTRFVCFATLVNEKYFGIEERKADYKWSAFIKDFEVKNDIDSNSCSKERRRVTSTNRSYILSFFPPDK